MFIGIHLHLRTLIHFNPSLMKKLVSAFACLLALTVTYSCSDQDVLADIQAPKSDRISESQAIDIAAQFRASSPMSRGVDALATPDVTYVFDDEAKSTSSAASLDTVAYILNYENDNGFVIVAGSNKVNPILAFSNTGSFSVENESAMENFVKRIPEYIKTHSSSVVSRSTSGTNAIEVVEPLPSLKLHQGSPYNQYQDDPSLYVGCVTVATANCLIHGTSILNYGGHKFYFKGILNGYHNSNATAASETVSPNYTPTVSELHPYYTKSQAVDSVARLLSILRKDLNISNSGTGFSTRAYSLLKSIEKVKFSSDYEDYDLSSVVSYLKDDNIIYMSGDGYEQGSRVVGHAWVITGYMHFPMYGGYQDLLYCDWGWGDSGNGYYYGAVFTPNATSYVPSKYFAIKLDHTPYMIGASLLK